MVVGQQAQAAVAQTKPSKRSSEFHPVHSSANIFYHISLSTCIPPIVLTSYKNKKNRQESEARQSILNQILHPEAADRLGRIRLVKEERATDVENRLIMLARTGQLRQKVTEAQLKELLNAVAETKEEEKIVVSRRKAWDDEEDDDLLDL